MERFVGLFVGDALAEPLWAGIWLKNGEVVNIALEISTNEWISSDFWKGIDYENLEYRNGKLVIPYFDGRKIELTEIDRIDWEDLSDSFREELEFFEKEMEL